MGVGHRRLGETLPPNPISTYHCVEKKEARRGSRGILVKSFLVYNSRLELAKKRVTLLVFYEASNFNGILSVVHNRFPL